jgi:Brp/Blh family beta-carotene 15,15'-monooxygenase
LSKNFNGPPQRKKMGPLKIQGMLFSLLALILSATALVLPPLNPQVELYVFATLVLVLGVPHGALDPIFARQLYGIRTLRGWAAFAVIYVALGALVVWLWWLMPGVFLMLFLVASAVHFSGDLVAQTPRVARVFYGGAVIFFPVLLHAAEVSQLFGFLAGTSAADTLVTGMRWLAWPWLMATALVSCFMWRRDWLTALEITSVSLLAIAVPPLLAFTVFFCVMHSARHALRAQQYAALSAPRLLLTSAAPMTAVLAGTMLSLYFFKDLTFDMHIVQLVFVGLAALTAPHMLLVERVRSSGWVRPGVS